MANLGATGGITQTTLLGDDDRFFIRKNGEAIDKFIKGSDLSSGVQGKRLAVNAQTGTSYTLLTSDHNKIVILDNAAAVTVTVPSGLGTGFKCDLIQLGAGTVSVAGDGGITVNNRQGHSSLAGQYACVSLKGYTASEFSLCGDTA